MESQSMDDSLCIMYENIIPRPEVEIVNEIERTRSEENVPQEIDICIELDQEPAQAAAGVSQANEDDDLVRILGKKMIQQVKRFVQNAENEDDENDDDAPSGNRKEVKCGICLDDLDVILESNRKLGSTICGHMFCDMCMNISKKNSNFCPTCRKRLGNGAYFPPCKSQIRHLRQVANHNLIMYYLIYESFLKV
ncbi:hypothetical protein JTE90_005036 [Oedothorax gibbosus]|uniref:RING-type domain-containing protein n=1 Tax=Oedothorax gibbosus TaxID=931172 RepID=A0AAV6VCV3_9ARAC|nr:hypothetical protein JTE90_005036 [Oedothorax gibbosus]